MIHLSNTRGWDLKRAMRNLDVHWEKFTKSDHGEAAGYSYHNPYRNKTFLAIDDEPLQEDPTGKMVEVTQEMVAFHELGHIVLGHSRLSGMHALAGRTDIHERNTPAFEVDAMKVTVAVAQRLGVPNKEANYPLLDNYIRSFGRQVRRYGTGGYTPASDKRIAEVAEKIIEAGL